MASGDSFRNLLSDFQKQEAELQISWNGGSTIGTIARICEDCIVVKSVGSEAGFVHVIPLANIGSVRVDDPDQAEALAEALQAVSTEKSADLRNEPSDPITIKPLNTIKPLE